MASRQAPKSTPSSSNTMGIKGSSTSNLSSHGKNQALPKGSDTLGLPGGTQVGNAGLQKPSVSFGVGMGGTQSDSKTSDQS